MSDMKKLKRGLGDVSPLFQSAIAETLIPSRQPDLLQWLSIYSPEHCGDSGLLTSTILSKITGSDQRCSLVTLRKVANEDLAGQSCGALADVENISPLMNKVKMGWDELGEILQSEQYRKKDSFGHQLFLFDYDHSVAYYQEKMIPLLDQMMLFLKPNLENLTEAYKAIKAMSFLNPQLDYFLIVDTFPGDPKSEKMFEKFSNLISSRLHASIQWLGNIDFSKGVQPVVSDLSLESLNGKKIDGINSLEKVALANFIKPYFKTEDVVLGSTRLLRSARR